MQARFRMRFISLRAYRPIKKYHYNSPQASLFQVESRYGSVTQCKLDSAYAPSRFGHACPIKIYKPSLPQINLRNPVLYIFALLAMLKILYFFSKFIEFIFWGKSV